MITRGSKFFYAAAAAGFLAAILYGFLTGASDHGGVFSVFSDGGIVKSLIGPLTLGWKGWVGEHVGYVTLMAFAAVNLGIGAFATATRDADVEAVAALEGVALADVPAATVPVGLSFWPLLAAVSAGLVVVGLAFNTWLFYAGVVGLAVAGFEWTVRAWSERTTGDPAVNKANRDRIMRPLEVPVGAVLVIALVGVTISRVLLALPKAGAAAFIIVLAAMIFGLANLLATQPHLRRPIIIWVLVVGALVLIGGGIAAGIAGPRAVDKESGTGALVVGIDGY